MFASAGTHTVTVGSGGDTISCPAVEIKNTCPSAVHGGGYAGCVVNAPNAHNDSAYYCSTGTCYACDAGTLWSDQELGVWIRLVRVLRMVVLLR